MDNAFIELVKDHGLKVGLVVVLFYAVTKLLPQLVTAWKEDRQSHRDHEFRMATLEIEAEKRPKSGTAVTAHQVRPAEQTGEGGRG